MPRAEIYAHGERLAFFFTRNESLTSDDSNSSLELGWLYEGDYMNPRTYCVPFYCNSNLYVENGIALHSLNSEYVKR